VEFDPVKNATLNHNHDVRVATNFSELDSWGADCETFLAAIGDYGLFPQRRNLETVSGVQFLSTDSLPAARRSTVRDMYFKRQQRLKTEGHDRYSVFENPDESEALQGIQTVDMMFGMNLQKERFANQQRDMIHCVHDSQRVVSVMRNSWVRLAKRILTVASQESVRPDTAAPSGNGPRSVYRGIIRPHLCRNFLCL
jgi:hypothetical protein